MAEWKQYLLENAQYIPFMLAARRSTDGQNVLPARINTTRIMESLIIAGVSGAIAMYGVQQQLTMQVAEIKAQMSATQTKLAELKTDMVMRENRIEDKVDAHVARTP